MDSHRDLYLFRCLSRCVWVLIAVEALAGVLHTRAEAALHIALLEGEFVRDRAELLSAESEAAVAALCADILAETEAPIFVFTIPTLSDERGAGVPIQTYAMALLERLSGQETPALDYDWGRAFLLLVARDDRKVRIELGEAWGHKEYELAGLIREDEILPRFKKGAYAEGITKGLEGLRRLARGEPISEPSTFHFPLYTIPAGVGLVLCVVGLVGYRKGWFVSKVALHNAARLGRLQDATRLIRLGAPLGHKDADGHTPLYYAARSGHFGMVKLLRDAGASPNFNDAPLIQAIKYGHSEVARSLLASGANPDIAGPGGETALIAAARRADEELLQLLLEMKARINTRDEKGRSALFAAVESRDPKTVQFLLESGAAVNVPAQDGATPLMLAVSLVEEEIVRILLNAGADPSASTKAGESPVTEAVLQDNARIMKLLVDAGADVSQEVDICVASEPASDEANDEGADTFSERVTLRELAERHGHRKVIALLDNRKSKKKAKHSDDLLEAVDHDDYDRVKAILRKKPHRVHRRSRDSGWGALHLAVKNRDVKMVKLLLRYGAKVDQKNSRGKTPLHQAAELGDEAIVQLLLDKGANPMETYKTSLPFERAMERGHTVIAQIIQQYADAKKKGPERG